MPDLPHTVTEVMFEERHLRLLRIRHTPDGPARLLKIPADADAADSVLSQLIHHGGFHIT